MSGKVGGVEGVGSAENGVEIEELARYAVDEYNKQQVVPSLCLRWYARILP